MKRNEGESFEEYKIRRKKENERMKQFDNGTVLIKGHPVNRKESRKVQKKTKHHTSQDKFLSKTVAKRREKKRESKQNFKGE